MEKTKKLGLGPSEPDAVRAGAGEFILEGLYAHKRISRNEEAGLMSGSLVVVECPDEGVRSRRGNISEVHPLWALHGGGLRSQH